MENKFLPSFEKATQLEQSSKLRVFNEDKFPTSFGKTTKIEHLLKL